MSPPAVTYPDDENLQAGLDATFRQFTTCKPGKLRVQDRIKNQYSSTFPSEVVEYGDSNGMVYSIFCKYGQLQPTTNSDHREGTEYESRVYDRLLGVTGLSLPRYYGAYQPPSSREHWLFLEHLSDSSTINKATGDHCSPELAARWIAEFHRWFESDSSTSGTDFLKDYDAGYYQRWGAMFASSVEDLGPEYPWLARVVEKLDQAFELLLSAPQTVIHGEYYPKNILYRHGKIYPIDWESTATGPGEIDLGALLEAWDPQQQSAITEEYRRIRWPEGGPHDFDKTLCAASIYWNLRWLAAPAKRSSRKWYLDQLEKNAIQLGVLD